jgi:hypothetical protein
MSDEYKKLTKMDIDSLLEAIEIWEEHENTILQTHEYLRSQYTDPEKIKEFDAITEPKKLELEQESLSKRDRSIILKFKLVRMKESLDADEILDEISKEQENK